MPNFNLKYGSPKHKDILEALRQRILTAQFAIANKTVDYKNDEEQFMAYMPERDVDVARNNKKALGDPQFTTLTVPYSYAVLMSWHTYISTVFLARSPVLQFAGRHGQSEQQTQAVEAIMDYQTQVGEHLVPYYIWFMDAGKYGVGIIGEYWDEESIQVSEIVEEPVTYLGIPLLGKTSKKKVSKRVKGYTGNKIFNVRPQDFFFDSRVSLFRFQQGEYCGRETELGWHNILKREDSGQYYNIDALRQYKKKMRMLKNPNRDLGSPQMKLPDAVTGTTPYMIDDVKTPDFVNLQELYVELVPADWGLGSSKYPEKWVFTVAENEMIIESQPYSCLHGKFPFSAIEYEIEGYGMQTRSMLEVISPLEDTMNWLINTHFYNVRSVLNGQFLADPSRITMKDFKSEGGGRIIRLKPTAYGQDIRTMFQQLQTFDVTQNHLRDMSMVGDLIQRVSGVTDNIMGMVNAGGRKTATEIRSSNVSGANRLKTQAEYISAMGMSPSAQRMLQNTQQYLDTDLKYRIAGDLMEEGQQFVQVDPNTISGFYDFVPVDGTMPIDRYAQVTMWTQLLGQMRNFPQIMMQYNMGGIFAWVAQLGGLKNIKRFRINVVPDSTVANQLQQGNLIGAQDVRQLATGNGGTPENSTGVPGAAQLPGMGPSG